MTRARTLVTIAVVAAAALGAAAGCSRPGTFTASNVLLISMDTLRADRLGCYGDPFARTPFWDRLARQGCQFRTMVTPGPFTLPSHATLLGGAQPWRHRARQNDARVVPPEPTLAKLLGDVGLATAAFVGSDVLADGSGIEAGFGRWDWRGRRGAHERPAEHVIRAASQWVRELDPAQRFFLFVHVYDAHDPYEPAAPWGEVIADPYAAEIAATDRTLMRLLREVESEARLERTMIVATADHGEAFGEHGETGHGFLVYDTTLRVPLVLWGPMPFRGGSVRSDLARTVDVLPTVLEAMRVGTRANRPGRALQIRLKPYREDALEAYAETFYAAGQFGAADLRTLRVGPWKYVRAPRAEFYDLAADPGENRNLFAVEPERAARLAGRMEEMLGDDLSRPAGFVDAPQVDEERREALAALGYAAPSRVVDWADLSGRRDPKDLVGIPDRLDRAMAASREKNWERALPLLHEVLALDEANPDAIRLLARERIERGRTEEALSLYERALERHGDSARLWADYGVTLLQRGRPDAAREALERAVALDPGNLEAHLHLATAARRSGRVEQARSVLEDVLARHPDHRGATRALRDLDRPRNP